MHETPSPSTPNQEVLTQDSCFSDANQGSYQEDALARLRAIQLCVKSRVHEHLPNAIQEVLGRIVHYMPELLKSENHDLNPTIEIALSAMFANKPNLKIVRRLLTSLDRRLSPRVWFVLNRAEPFAFFTLFGSGVLIYFVISALYTLMSIYIATHPHGHLQVTLESATIFYTAAAGATGSIVAILSQIREFTFRSSNPTSAFIIGLTKPIIGSSLAVFIFLVLSSKMFSLTVTAGNPLHFFIAIGFLSGFSERFASDFISRTERSITDFSKD